MRTGIIYLNVDDPNDGDVFRIIIRESRSKLQLPIGVCYRSNCLESASLKRIILPTVRHNIRVAQSEFRKLLRFRVVAEKVHLAQPNRFTRRARNIASLKSGRGGGVVAELNTKKSVDSSKNRFFSVVYRGLKKSVDLAINHFFVRRLKQAIKIRRKRIFP